MAKSTNGTLPTKPERGAQLFGLENAESPTKPLVVACKQLKPESEKSQQRFRTRVHIEDKPFAALKLRTRDNVGWAGGYRRSLLPPWIWWGECQVSCLPCAGRKDKAKWVSVQTQPAILLCRGNILQSSEQHLATFRVEETNGPAWFASFGGNIIYSYVPKCCRFALYFLKNPTETYIFIHLHIGRCAMVLVWRSENNLWDSVLFLPYRLQGSNSACCAVGRALFDPLSHLIGFLCPNI